MKNKNLLITGAATRVGRAIALTLILGPNRMAIVFVNVCRPLLLIVYDIKKGVRLNIL